MAEHTLFEEGFLLRSLGAVTQQPEVAISELVANAWDAGASRVEITVPESEGGSISVSDDGVGMTATLFRSRWMRLGYNRLKHQGQSAEFPASRANWTRRAYGRNGIGRHGLLCFADRYTVETKRDGDTTARRFVVQLTSGESPFDMIADEPARRRGHGTTISTRVQRQLPSVEKVRDSLSFRFLHDPQFSIVVNAEAIVFEDQMLVAKTQLPLDGGGTAEVYCVEVPTARRRTMPHGVAFWVGGRLVGEPTYSLFGQQLLDGRTTVANRHMIVVRSNDLFDDVLPDWTGFRKTPRVVGMADAVGGYVNTLINELMSGRIEENKKEALRGNRDEIKKLKPLARIEINEFVDSLVQEHPTMNSDVLTSAVKAAVNLEKSRSGQALLEKLATISETDIELINRLLDSWTLRDALAVLDEVDRRIAVVEAISKLMDDPEADELHSIHPLVTQARWLFGPEFESPLYASNVTIKRAAESVFKKKIDVAGITNPRQRPDLIFLKDSTISLTGTESFDESGSITKLQYLLLIELKRGKFRIKVKEMQQAVQYVHDLLNCNVLDGAPFVKAFVVGDTLDRGVRPQAVGDQPVVAKVEPVTFGQLIRVAKQRLFKLQDQIAERYRNVPGLDLVDRILGEPVQRTLFRQENASRRPRKRKKV